MQEMPFRLVRHRPPDRLAGVLTGLATYAERGTPTLMRESVPLRVPVILSFGTPFRIALGRDPSAADRQASFAAGLWPGAVHIASDGGAACVQADLHPLHAVRVFGGAVVDLAGRMAGVDDVFGAAGRRLVERAGNAAEAERAGLLAAFLAERLGPEPSAVTRFAWDALARSGGRARIAAIAADHGISRTRLATLFRREVGVPPKTAARMMRFARARRLAGNAASWADVAVAAGYADQAHLIREWVAFAGETPVEWARRVARAPWLAADGP